MRSLDEVHDDAIHGSFCPKMCNHVCPVLSATGREGAAPWGLHTVVAALAGGERSADEGSYRALRGCTGCHACNEACMYDLDVSDEVRAARTAIVAEAGRPSEVAAVAEAIVSGRSPYGTAPPDLPAPPDGPPEVIVLVGCAADQGSVDALEQLYATSGVTVRYSAPDGCCGAVAADLGDAETASSARDTLAAGLERADDGPEPRIVATDPHCLDPLRTATDLEVRDLATELVALLDEGRLDLDDGMLGDVTYHDPCVLARGEDVVEAPRRLLTAAGAEIVEPEGHGRRTHCSGAGMGFELIAVDEAAAVASRRAEQLARGGRVVTACARARDRIGRSGLDVEDLAVVLATALRRSR